MICFGLGYISFINGSHRGTLWFLCVGPESLIQDSFRKPETVTLMVYILLLAIMAHLVFGIRVFWFKLCSSFKE